MERAVAAGAGEEVGGRRIVGKIRQGAGRNVRIDGRNNVVGRNERDGAVRGRGHLTVKHKVAGGRLQRDISRIGCCLYDGYIAAATGGGTQLNVANIRE